MSTIQMYPVSPAPQPNQIDIARKAIAEVEEAHKQAIEKTPLVKCANCGRDHHAGGTIIAYLSILPLPPQFCDVVTLPLQYVFHQHILFYTDKCRNTFVQRYPQPC